MKSIALKRGALLLGGALIAVASGPVLAQNLSFPPGTNCSTVLPAQQAACGAQAQSLGATGANPTVPNSANSGTSVDTNNPNTVILPNERANTTGVTGFNPNTAILPRANAGAGATTTTGTTITNGTNGTTTTGTTTTGTTANGTITNGTTTNGTVNGQ